MAALKEPNIFDLIDDKVVDGVQDSEIKKPDTLEDSYFIDLVEWHKSNPKVNFPPDPATFSKESLAKHPGMDWLNLVDCELVYPQGKTFEEHKAELLVFRDRLYAELWHIPQSLCPKFPEGFNEPVLALDTETTGLDVRVRYIDGKLTTRTLLVGLCLASSGEVSYYLPVRHTEEDGIPNWNPQAIIELIDEFHRDCVIIYSNAAYDREVLTLNGCKVQRPFPYFFDDQILDFMTDVNNKRHGLKLVSERKLGRKMVEINELFRGFGTKKTKSDYIVFDTLPAVNAYVYGACVSGETEVEVELSYYRRYEYVSVCDKKLPPKFIPYSLNMGPFPGLTPIGQRSLQCNLLANAGKMPLYDGMMFNKVIQDLVAKIAALSTDLTFIGRVVSRKKELNLLEDVVLRRGLDTLNALIQQVRRLLSLSVSVEKNLLGFHSMLTGQKDLYSVRTVKENKGLGIDLEGINILFGTLILILRLENLVRGFGGKRLGTDIGQLRSLLVTEGGVSSRGLAGDWRRIISIVGRLIRNLESFISMECHYLSRNIHSSIKNMENEETHMNSSQSSFLRELEETLNGQTSNNCVRATITIDQLRELILTQKYLIKVDSRYGFVNISAFIDKDFKQTLSINGRPPCSLDQRYEIFDGTCLVWREARELRVGDYLSIVDGGLEVIYGIEETGIKKVYDLSLDHYGHCYWASGISAHNCDALNTYKLFEVFSTIKDNNVLRCQPLPLELDHKMVDVSRRMCRPGIPVNFRYMYYAALDALQRFHATEEFIYKLVGRKIELGSPKQLAELLYKELDIPTLRNHKMGVSKVPSTDKDHLEELYLLHPDVLQLKYIVFWRQLNNALVKFFNTALVNSYVDEVIPFTKIQPSFSQTNVPTGRLSSSSSDGAERLTLKISKKTERRTYAYHSGSWDAGTNTQGISSAQFKHKTCKKINSLPIESGVDLNNLYMDGTRDLFRRGLAEI